MPLVFGALSLPPYLILELRGGVPVMALGPIGPDHAKIWIARCLQITQSCTCKDSVCRNFLRRLET
jgi:hypothetical protein